MEVVESGSEPIRYQWHQNGAPIAGETESTLRLVNLKTVDMGDYHVVVSNGGGETTSDSVSLSTLPIITKLTESMTPVKGEDYEFSVKAVIELSKLGQSFR